MQSLDGVLVVSLEQAVAAPLASRHLADLGATVIKIERPVTGDFARKYDATVKGLSSHFVWLNRGKQSISLDIKKPEGLKVLETLLEQADIFIQNLAPGAIDRLGFGKATLERSYPNLIACNISGYGSEGPMQHKKAYDLLIQAESGLLDVTGTEEQPAKVGISIADIACGMYAFSGILSELYHRERFGGGHVFEVSLFDSMVEWMGYPAYYTYYGSQRPARTGIRHATIFPYGAFAVGQDETIMLAIQNDHEWQTFCQKVLQLPNLGEDERFSSNSTRVQNRNELTEVIENAFAKQSLGVLVQKLNDIGIANAEVKQVKHLLKHPQLTERNRILEMGSPIGPLWTIRPPLPRMDGVTQFDAVPDLGEHTSDVLKRFGYTETEISDLRQKRCI